MIAALSWRVFADNSRLSGVDRSQFGDESDHGAAAGSGDVRVAALQRCMSDKRTRSRRRPLSVTSGFSRTISTSAGTRRKRTVSGHPVIV